MLKLNLKKQITSAIMLFILSFLAYSQCYAQCKVHHNFKEIVDYLKANSNNYYDVQVTIINPGRSGGKTHRYSAWNSTYTLRSSNICKEGIHLPKTKIYFSGRDHFDKKRADIQTFKFDVVHNSVDVILNSWDDTKIPVRNLVKKGRLIYGVDEYGKMVVFNFRKLWKKGSGSGKILKEDCLSFNPNNIKIENNRIVDGNHWLFAFPNYEEAKKSFYIIKKYGLNQTCFVGRPDPSFTYLLKNGKSPVGTISDEDCIGFDPKNLYLKQEGTQYLMTDGRSRKFMFPNKAEAETALAMIKKYGFTKTCYVGRPNASLQYMRR